MSPIWVYTSLLRLISFTKCLVRLSEKLVTVFFSGRIKCPKVLVGRQRQRRMPTFVEYAYPVHQEVVFRDIQTWSKVA